MRNFRQIMWNADEKRSVLNQKRTIPVIGMIIVGAVRQDEIGSPFANQPHDLFAFFKADGEGGIRIVENLCFDS